VHVAHGAGDLAGGDLEDLGVERGIEVAVRAGWIFALRACVMSGGSQPISSSRPTTIRRSALFSLNTKLGLASTKCGS